MFTIKFWFFAEYVSSSNRLRNWLFIWKLGRMCVCVAIQRVIAVSRVNFDKQQSQTTARWTIVALPFAIIHEPLHRRLFDDEEMEAFWCITRYSTSVQYYNFLFIIVGTVRQQ
jgi:hypothetical protein